MLKSAHSEADARLELKTVFNLYQHKGKILVSDLPKVLYALSVSPDLETATKKINRELDKDGKEEAITLDFEEFVSTVSGFVQYRPSDRDEEVFLLFDRNGVGALSFEALRKTNKELNAPLSDAELRNIIRFCSSTPDHTITKDDFIRALSEGRKLTAA